MKSSMSTALAFASSLLKAAGAAVVTSMSLWVAAAVVQGLCWVQFCR